MLVDCPSPHVTESTKETSSYEVGYFTLKLWDWYVITCTYIQ